jgi:hypothetical protein
MSGVALLVVVRKTPGCHSPRRNKEAAHVTSRSFLAEMEGSDDILVRAQIYVSILSAPELLRPVPSVRLSPIAQIHSSDA